ncbi:MAG: hypothetical protein LBQ38_12815 [Spirochaetaceae bacterium]|jgi:hypothetical protein|nr:hypothetical protein [Spirochaetaceae bacterium]
MTIENIREPEMGLNFEKVWAMFQETDRRFKETDRKMQETDRKISKLGDRLGDLVEHLVAPNILEKFNDLGYRFGKAGTNVRFKDSNLVPVAEVDILLENGDVSLAVEVKAKLTIPDVQEHMARMEKLRSYADEHGDQRKLMGAVAGAIIPEGVKPFAIRNGFYVLEQTGDTVKIDIPGDFIPREW